MSLRRFRGWEPKQTHTVVEWDDQSRPLRWVTEIEPEFDSLERNGWHELEEYETAICRDCGNLRSVCSDPMQLWYPQRTICYATADLSVHRRRWAKKNENARPDHAGRLPDDGTTLWVSTEDLTPDDKFL